MAELIRGLDPEVVRRNLEEVRATAGPGVQVLAAVKYVAAEELPVLAEAGVELVGENRQQALADKLAAEGAGRFTWDFIGQLQSRKVKELVGRVRWIHSVASDSALKQLAAHAPPEQEVLVQVNVAREPAKDGVDPDDLPGFLARCPCRVVGLMTMPPATDDPEGSRRWFAALAELAAEHGLPELSMGTSQDWRVAVEEGATVVRLGAGLLR